MTEFISQLLTKVFGRTSQATPGLLDMVDFEPFFLLMAARQNVTTD